MELTTFLSKHAQTLDQVVNHKYLSNNLEFINDMQALHVATWGTKFLARCPSCTIEAATRIAALSPHQEAPTVEPKKRKRK